MSLKDCLKFIKPHLGETDLKSLESSTDPELFVRNLIRGLSAQQNEAIRLIAEQTVTSAMQGENSAVETVRKADIFKSEPSVKTVEFKPQTKVKATNSAVDDFLKSKLIPSATNVKQESKKHRGAFGRTTRALTESFVDKLPRNLPAMTFWERILRSPEWYDHPVIKKIVRAAIERHDRFHEYFNGFNKSDNPFSDDKSITQVINELKYKGLNKVSAVLRGKSSPEYKQYERIKDEADTDPAYKNMTQEETVRKWRKEGISEDAINAWKLTRESYDKQLDKLIEPMRAILEKKKEQVAFQGGDPNLADIEGFITYKDETTGKLNSMSLKEVIAEMESWKGHYAPRLRVGNWVVKAYKGAGPAREFWREHKPTKLGANRLAQKLIDDGWTIEKTDKGRLVHENQKLTEQVLQHVNVREVAQLLKQAVGGMQDVSAELETLFNEELIQILADKIRARGFRSAMIHRKAQVVGGYITDPLERYVRYTSNMSAGFAKADTALEMSKLLLGQKTPEGEEIDGIDPEKERRAYEVASRYIQEQLRNADMTDRMVGLAKSVASFKYLGFPNVRAPFINKTAMVTTVPAAIHEYTLKGKVNFGRILKSLAKAEIDYDKFMITGKGEHLTVNERAWLSEIKEKGYDDPQYTRDAIGLIQNLQGKTWSKIMQGSMWMFGKTEQSNRGATLLAAYRLARKQGNTPKVAQELAKSAMEKAHGVYHKATLPEWAQGANIAAKAGQMMYVYAKFGHNWMQMMYDLGIKKKNLRAFVWAFASQPVLAGANALPMAGITFAIIRGMMAWLGDDRDPEKLVWDGVRKHLGERGERGLRYGIVGLGGADISGSFAVDPAVPKNLIDLTGAIGGVFQDASLAKHYISTGQPYRSFEVLLPTGMGRILQGMREKEEGATTRSGRIIWDEKARPYIPSDWEIGLRMAGFRSARRATLQARQWETKKELYDFKQRRDEIYEQYRSAIASKDHERVKEVLQKVKEYNKNIRRYGKQREIPRITPQSLKNQRMRMIKPTKAQRAFATQ